MYFSVKEPKDIDLLFESQTEEGITLDYKSDIYSLDDLGKPSLLKDICAFANTRGGQIIVGIKEEKGTPTEITGISIENQDTLRLQLLDIIRTGIEPSLSGVEVNFINHTKGLILVINVPLSWNMPHWISYKGNSKVKENHKFYGRASGQNYELSHIEIKDKFIMSSSVVDKIKNFRKERIAQIEIQDDIPMQLDDGNKPKLVLHIIPLSSFSSQIECDLSEITLLFSKNMELFKPLGAPNNGSLPNCEITIDGFLTSIYTPENLHFPDSHRHMAYTHFYRSGIIEAVTNLQKGSDNNIVEPYIYSTDYERHLRNQRYLDILKALNLFPPFYLFISLLNIANFKLLHSCKEGMRGFNPSPKTYNKDRIFLREIVVESLEKPLDEILKPAFDQSDIPHIIFKK